MSNQYRALKKICAPHTMNNARMHPTDVMYDPWGCLRTYVSARYELSNSTPVSSDPLQFLHCARLIVSSDTALIQSHREKPGSLEERTSDFQVLCEASRGLCSFVCVMRNFTLCLRKNFPSREDVQEVYILLRPSYHDWFDQRNIRDLLSMSITKSVCFVLICIVSIVDVRNLFFLLK